MNNDMVKAGDDAPTVAAGAQFDKAPGSSGTSMHWAPDTPGRPPTDMTRSQIPLWRATVARLRNSVRACLVGAEDTKGCASSTCGSRRKIKMSTKTEIRNGEAEHARLVCPIEAAPADTPKGGA